MHGENRLRTTNEPFIYLIHFYSFTKTFKYISPLTNTINVRIDFIRTKS